MGPLIIELSRNRVPVHLWNTIEASGDLKMRLLKTPWAGYRVLDIQVIRIIPDPDISHVRMLTCNKVGDEGLVFCRGGSSFGKPGKYEGQNREKTKDLPHTINSAGKPGTDLGTISAMEQTYQNCKAH
jgi:hypothetical protein